MGEFIVIKRKISRPSPKKKSLPDEEFDRISWAIKARSTDYVRSLHAVKIDGDKIVATNGHILCISKITQSYPEGCYAVVLASWKVIVLEKIDVGYPDYTRILPTTEASSIVKVKTGGDWGLNDFFRKAYAFGMWSANYLKMVSFENEMILEFRDSGPTPSMVIKDKISDWQRFAIVMSIKE